MRRKYWLICLVCLSIVLLNLSLWSKQKGIPNILALKKELKVQEREINQLQKRNEVLDEEIKQIKRDPTLLEGFARYELGMIKKKETYYQVVEPLE